MKGFRRKKRTNSNLGQNQQPAPSGAHTDRKVDVREWRGAIALAAVGTITALIASLRGLWREQWMMYCILPLFAGCLSVMLGEFLMHSRRIGLKLVIASSILFLTTLLSLEVVLYSTIREKRFSFVAREKSVEIAQPRLWLVWNRGSIGPTASPIHIHMLADISNLTDKPAIVRSYQFLGYTTEGYWVVLPCIDVRNGDLCFLINTNFDLTRTVHINHSPNPLPAALNGKTFAPYETLPVWVFLEAPTNFAGNIRFVVEDSKAQRFVQEVEAPKEQQLLLNTIPFGETALTGPIRNISNLTQRRYSESFE